MQQQASAIREALVGRLPILNQQHEVVGYELLLRRTGASAEEIDRQIAEVLTFTLMDMGIDQVAGRKPVFLRVTAQFLSLDLTQLLPADKVALVLPADLPIDGKVVETCKSLHARGYLLMLDDRDWSAELAPLMPTLRMVRFDVGRSDLAQQLTAYRQYPVRFVAGNVETLMEHDRARQAGCTFFQGYFFCQPDAVRGKRLPDSKIAILRALQKVMSAESIREVEEVVKQDVGLSYRLLRYLNSAAFNMMHKIDSVQQALNMLGLNNIRRWLSVLAMSSLGEGKPAELVRMALWRGRMLEGLAEKSGMAARKSDYFILGLFSLLDAILDQPMQEALSHIALPAEVRQGLLEPESPLGRKLALVALAQRGDWKTMRTLLTQEGIDLPTLAALNVEATEWVEEFSSLQ